MLRACLTLYARVHIQSPQGGVIFVVSTTSNLDDTEKQLNTFILSHLISDATLSRRPLAWLGPMELTLYIFNDSAWVSSMQQTCYLKHSFIHLTLDSSNSRNSKQEKHKGLNHQEILL